MAWVGLTNVYQSGVLERVSMVEKYPFYPLEYMSSQIEKGIIGLKSVCPGVSLKDLGWSTRNGNSCADFAYDIGF